MHKEVSSSEPWLFLIFGLVVTIFLIIDLGVFQKNAHKITVKSALYQSIFWVVISLSFAALIYYLDNPEEGAHSNHENAYEFLSAYLMEKALSVDNIFVFILILSYFKVDEIYYHKILFYGIIGAIFFRAIFIGVGGALIHEFHWILYLFGLLLIITGFKMLFTDKETKFEPEKNFVYRILKRYLRFTSQDSAGKLFFKIDSKIYFTTTFLVIALIETTDIVFALDSIPACFAISQNEFIVYTSNIFAVLGLRAMFFLLVGVINRFKYLQHGISLILIFIGSKMLLEWFDIKIAVNVSLLIILLVLIISIIVSWVISARDKKKNDLLSL